MTKEKQTKIAELEQRIAVLERKMEAMELNAGYAHAHLPGGGWL